MEHLQSEAFPCLRWHLYCGPLEASIETHIEGMEVVCSTEVYEFVNRFRRSSHRQYKTNTEHHNHDSHLIAARFPERALQTAACWSNVNSKSTKERPRTPYNKKYTRPCTTSEKLTKNNTAFENQLQFVSDAVMALAVALQDMHRELCPNSKGLCDAMIPTKGPELLKYLRQVHFEGLSGDKFKFDTNGDGPARYNIIHFKQVSHNNFQWVRVGEYEEGNLRLRMDALRLINPRCRVVKRLPSFQKFRTFLF
ncbi:unnamed protein product, partial [Nesidiocoris tenuis]